MFGTEEPHAQTRRMIQLAQYAVNAREAGDPRCVIYAYCVWGRYSALSRGVLGRHWTGAEKEAFDAVSDAGRCPVALRILGWSVTDLADQGCLRRFVRVDPDHRVPHHPHYVRTEPASDESGGPRFVFTPFTGREDEPVVPECPVADGEDPAMARVWAARRVEYYAARREWARARYAATVTPWLHEAAFAWPRVREAYRQIERAWAALDAPHHGFESAIKVLLDTHDAAGPVVGAWQRRHAERLACFGEELVDVRAVEWRALARRLGYRDADSWHVGDADDYQGGRRAGGGGTPTVLLALLVRQQRERLRDVRAAAGTRVPQVAGETG